MPVDSANDNDSNTNNDRIIYNIETESKDDNIVQDKEEPSESTEAKLSKRNRP